VRREALEKLLRDVAGGKLPAGEALEKLAAVSFADLGYAKLDTGRHSRCGFPEVIYCEGKSRRHLAGIATSLSDELVVVATRASKEDYEVILGAVPHAVYHEEARVVIADKREDLTLVGNILVASAGTSDFPVAEEAALVAEAMGNLVRRVYDVGVAGVHRLLAHTDELGEARVVIAVAGMEGALPSVVAGLVGVPVIGVPTSVGYGASFGGLASLLAMLNSCAGRVAVVNIDNGYGAACIASSINHA